MWKEVRFRKTMKEREGVEGTEWGWGNFCGVSVGPCSVSTENCWEERDGEGGIAVLGSSHMEGVTGGFPEQDNV